MVGRLAPQWDASRREWRGGRSARRRRKRAEDGKREDALLCVARCELDTWPLYLSEGLIHK